MRFLFTTTRFLGHAMPLLPFATAARDAGHEVVLAGPARIAPLAAEAGLRHAELASPDPEAPAAARRRVAGSDGEEKIRVALGDLFVATYGGAALSGRSVFRPFPSARTNARRRSARCWGMQTAPAPMPDDHPPAGGAGAGAAAAAPSSRAPATRPPWTNAAVGPRARAAVPRCPHTRLTKPECHCRPCLAELVAAHGRR